MSRLSRRRVIGIGLAFLAAMVGGFGYSSLTGKSRLTTTPPDVARIPLSQPKQKGETTLEEAIAKRRSIREYAPSYLTLEEVSQLLWAAQGITQKETGFRAAPSAGGTYPLELYVVVRDSGVDSLAQGVYKYIPATHELSVISEGDFRDDLTAASLDQPWVESAQINLVVTAIYSRTTARYGDRGFRYVHMEVGHVGQNVYLQATALGLGAVVIGAFHDDEVKRVVRASEDEAPLYVIPVGKR